MLTRNTLLALIVTVSAGTLALADPALTPPNYTDGGPKRLDTSLKVGNEPKRMTRYMDHREVFNEKGDQIGTVNDIVLDSATAGISYLVLSYSGSDKLFAVPWQAFIRKSDKTERLHLFQSDDTLKKAPGFDKDHWPDTANPEFRASIDTYYDTYVMDADGTIHKVDRAKELPAKAAPVKDGIAWSRRASAIIESKVVNKQSEDLGVIKDIVFNPNTGAIHYAVLSYGGFLNKGDKFFAVPIRAFDAKAENVLVLDASREYLANNPGFDKDLWPRWDDKDSTQKLDDFNKITNRTTLLTK
jgi:sporulation protein YlmC with PRC-barrel domain